MLWIFWLFGVATSGSNNRDGNGGTAPLIVVNALEGQQQQQQQNQASSSSTWITLTQDTFETGWGNFKQGVDGSKKAKRTNKGHPCNGDYSVELKDDKTNGESSILLRDSIDVTPYSNLQVSLKFLLKSYDTSLPDKFVLEYTPDENNEDDPWMIIKEFQIDATLFPNKYRYWVIRLNRSKVRGPEVTRLSGLHCN